jgi:hypothetical protein
MGWPDKDSWEVCLVLRVLETLQRGTECLDPETGEIRHRVYFTRERSISQFHDAVGKRFDFSGMVHNGKFGCEFLIEVHGERRLTRSRIARPGSFFTLNSLRSPCSSPRGEIPMCRTHAEVRPGDSVSHALQPRGDTL